MTRPVQRAALALLALFALVGLLGPLLPLDDPARQDPLLLRGLPPMSTASFYEAPDGTRTFFEQQRGSESDGTLQLKRGRRWVDVEAGGSWQTQRFILGTDLLGRDLLSRWIHGARVSLGIGVLASLIALVIGALVGLSAGWIGGWMDAILMRFTDLVLAIPRLFLALLLVALWGASTQTTVLALGLTTWMAAARLVRAEVLSGKQREWISAARAGGASGWRVALRHLFPATFAPLMVETALRVGDTILLESALSFLGLGVRPPLASWGNLIAEGRGALLSAWWITTLPGISVVLTVLCLTLLGDGFRHGLGEASRNRLGDASGSGPGDPSPVQLGERDRNSASESSREPVY